MQTKEESLEMKLKARDLEIETLKDTLSMSNTHRLGGFKNIVPNGFGLNNRFNVVLARVSGALAFTVKLLKKKKSEECDGKNKFR